MCCDTCVVSSGDAKWIKIFFAFLTLSNLVRSKSKIEFYLFFQFQHSTHINSTESQREIKFKIEKKRLKSFK